MKPGEENSSFCLSGSELSNLHIPVYLSSFYLYEGLDALLVAVRYLSGVSLKHLLLHISSSLEGHGSPLYPNDSVL